MGPKRSMLSARWVEQEGQMRRKKLAVQLSNQGSKGVVPDKIVQ